MKLPLAVALALGSVNALALGLGPIQIKSGLNQPLVAEIAVNGGADETAGLNVALASADDFARVGLSRSRLTTPLEFSVVPGSKGGTVIRVTTQEAVKDPFLDFLLEVNWAKGKLLREYTVLLDPPVLAPAKGAAKPVAAAPSAGTKPVEAAPTKPAKPTKPAPTEAAPIASSTPPSTAKAPRTAQSGEYGPVNSGEALYDIASATRPDDAITVNQMMIALLRANPNAFYQDNINSLKRGAILRIPSSEEIKAAASAAAAAAEVKTQVEAWRAGSAVAKPTVVADTGSKPAPATKPVATTAPATTGTPAAKPGDKLALVPPKAGSGSQAGAEKVGSSTTGSSGDGAAKSAELARTKEALASREQEASELKSRVKELEDLKTKNDRLITLKDSELAELQKKLKELQDKAAKPGTTATTAAPAPTTAPTTATPPATTTATPATTSTPSATSSTSKPADKTGLTKEDIWGSAASTDSTKPTTPAATPTTSSTTPSTAPSTTASTAPATTASTAPSTTTSTTPATSSSTTPATTTSTAPSTSASTTPATTTSTTPSTTSPSATASAPAATTSAPVEPPKPSTSSTTPAKPSTPAKVQPLPAPTPEEPWYKKTWLLATAGVGLLGLVLLGLMNFMRRPKPVSTVGIGVEPPALDEMQDEEHDLLDRLAMHPDDTATHLELVSLYYARQDAEKFEDAAQAMYAHLGDTDSAEWEQIKAMGQELAPHNPLFSDHGMAAHHDFGSHPTPTRHQAAIDDDVFADVPSMAPPSARPTTPPPVAPPAPAPIEDAFDFDLTDHSVAAAPPPAAKPAPMEDFTLNMPAMDFDKELAAAAARVETPRAAPTPAPVAPKIEDDFAIGGEDATGTKLDLAKAYLDMGDPEGARSMLEEVLTEGNANQKSEASRLLKEIR